MNNIGENIRVERFTFLSQSRAINAKTNPFEKQQKEVQYQCKKLEGSIADAIGAMKELINHSRHQ
ncbi:hypothetical protein ACO0K0_00725 [Undibacterium sp. SXout11W]|uniref:hypothetical protein n=1 Tax=Undibacterium sp. SXout11W TaxID=3413050 RepID=UPI003BF040A8